MMSSPDAIERAIQEGKIVEGEEIKPTETSGSDSDSDMDEEARE